MEPILAGSRRAVRQRSHPAITQRLCNVPSHDRSGPFEVGKRARDAQHPVIAAGRKPQSFSRSDQQRTAGRLRGRNLVEQRSVGFGVGANSAFRSRGRVARRLSCAGRRDSPGDRRTALGGRRQSEIGRRHRRNIDMKIDAVQQRARQPALVVLRATRRAAAAALGEMTAAARVHRRD